MHYKAAVDIDRLAGYMSCAIRREKYDSQDRTDSQAAWHPHHLEEFIKTCSQLTLSVTSRLTTFFLARTVTSVAHVIKFF